MVGRITTYFYVFYIFLIPEIFSVILRPKCNACVNKDEYNLKNKIINSLAKNKKVFIIVFMFGCLIYQMVYFKFTAEASGYEKYNLWFNDVGIIDKIKHT